MAKNPNPGMCKKHPEVEAVKRHDGISTGCCAACLAARGHKGGKSSK
jgi:hypothetical protein